MPIYTLVKALTLSETACAPTRPHMPLKGSVSLITRPMCLHVPLHIWVLSHVPPRTVASGHVPLTHHHALLHASTLSLTSLLTSSMSALTCVVADVTCLRQPLTSSFDSGGLTVDYDRVVDFDR